MTDKENTNQVQADAYNMQERLAMLSARFKTNGWLSSAELIADGGQMIHDLAKELASVRADRDERAVQKRQFFAATEALQDEKRAITNEVTVVIMMLDELAKLWGDEGKFRTCRDRLWKLIPVFK